ncbi:Zinc finger BED domain-containing protein 5 [Trichinella zimbabwensis]|uniref:Zinc finger BED domain-containing protein 5 n=1 Tax=Trichinella zimbabwensis TaxID=268475 RepID=A0A0V1GR78_9BILA|nr:Zinc finger BED domain-containing protein 5 [Trichinella zimbabwensis]
MSMCLLCQKFFSNDAMKPSKMKDHLERQRKQSYTSGEEIIIPAIKEVIETVMQRRIDEMASDVEKTSVSELQHCKFSIQLAESAFGCSNILMAYVRYYSQSLKCIVDEFLFANYLKGDAKGETIFRCLEDYLKEHNVPLRNITAVATSSARAVTEDLSPYSRKWFLMYARFTVCTCTTSSCCHESQW